MELSRAVTKSKQYINKLTNWPEDDWIGIAKDWDLNVYDYDNRKGATLYPVNHFTGKTDTDTFYEVSF